MATPEPRRWRALTLLATAELLGMALWFSGSAVVPALSNEWQLSPSQISWIAISVQLGFVAGTLISATLNLPDIISTRHLFAVSAFLGAVVNGIFSLYVHDPSTAIVLRFLTGICLAGVYPPGIKIMATWFRERRGMARRGDHGKSDALPRQRIGERELEAERALRVGALRDRWTDRAVVCRRWSTRT